MYAYVRGYSHAFTACRARLSNHSRHTDSQTTCGYRGADDGVGADTATVANLDLPEYFGPSTNDHVVTYAWSAAPAAQISQGDPMIDRTAFADDSLGMNDDAPKMMKT